MARRTRSRTTKPRTRRTKSINLASVAESMVLANAVTTGMFGTNLKSFALEGWALPKSSGTLGGAGNSWTLSASELVSGLSGGGFGTASGAWSQKSLGELIKYNLDGSNPANGGAGRMVATLVFAPVAFRMGKKVLSKPRAQVNRLLSMSVGKGVRV